MTIQSWFEKRKEAQKARKQLEAKIEDDGLPGLWTKCVHCKAQIPNKDLEDNDNVCPLCDYHFRINARTRITHLFDEGSFEEMHSEVSPADPLEFKDTETYKVRIQKAKDKTNSMDTRQRLLLWTLTLWAVQWVALLEKKLQG